MVNFFQIDFQENPALNKGGIAVGYSYVSKLRSIKFVDFARIDIILTNKDNSEEEIHGINGKICRIFKPFDIVYYATLSEKESGKLLYELVFEIMETIAGLRNWEMTAFHEIREEIVSADYSFPITYGKRMKNPSKKLSAEITVELFSAHADFKLSIYDKAGTLQKSMPIYKTSPYPLLFQRFFAGMSWSGDDLVKIEDMNKEIFFVGDIQREEVRIELHPDQNTKEELNALLKGLYYETPDDERLKLLGLPAV
jgi:hypothetical protein